MICTRCQAPFTPSAVDAYLVSTGALPPVTLDPLCRLLAKVPTRTYVTQTSQTSAMSRQQALSALEARRITRIYTKDDVLDLVQLWMRQHDGRLPTSEEFRNTREIGVSQSVVYRLWPDVWALYTDLACRGACGEAEVRVAARAMMRIAEGQGWLRAWRKSHVRK